MIIRLPVGAAAGLGGLFLIALAGCAARMDAAENTINRDLNRGGAKIDEQLRRLHKATITGLAQDAPVCVAYALSGATASDGAELRSVLERVAAALRQNEAVPSKLTVYYGQHPGRADITAEVVALKPLLPADWRPLPMYTQPMPSRHFRQTARCPGKSTIFIADQDVQFLTTLPVVTLEGNMLSADLILFIVVDKADGAQL